MDPLLSSSDSTPPSPPRFPWELSSSATSPLTPSPRRDAFTTLLGKRKPLHPLSDNLRTTKKPAIATAFVPAKSLRRPAKVNAKPLTQLQISLGQTVQKTCPTCSMEYVASSAEDRKVHSQFHKQHVEGYDVGTSFVKNAREGTSFPSNVENHDGGRDVVCMIEHGDKAARRRHARAVLAIVQKDLGAVPISDAELWDARAGGRYRVYMCIRGTKCVGFLLVQRITDAFTVLEPPVETKKQPAHPRLVPQPSRAKTAVEALHARRRRLEEEKAVAKKEEEEADLQPLQLSAHPVSARMGISRIWTLPRHRQQHIATSLLDAALMHSRQISDWDEQTVDDRKDRSGSPKARGPLGKDMVAFSHPTQSGTRLARRWFGKRWGWSVYVG